MKLHRMEGRAKSGGTTWGSIWEKGTVFPDSEFVLTNSEGQRIPVQSSVAAYWPDHSVKWTSHTADAARMGASAEILPSAKEFGTAQEKEAGAGGIAVEESEDCLTVRTGRSSLRVMKSGRELIRDWKQVGGKDMESVRLVLLLEERFSDGEDTVKKESRYYGEPDEVTVEECGPLKCVIRAAGMHIAASGGEKARRCCPFVLRMTIWNHGGKIDFQHTMIYDGNVAKDSLKGLGMQFFAGLEGAVYNRHIRFAADGQDFHEPALLLTSWRPPIPMERYEAQLRGECLAEEGEEAEAFRLAEAAMPVWSNYRLFQDSAEHFVIDKSTGEKNCGYIQARHGRRAPGALAFGDRSGGFLLGKKDFWQKYPSSLEVNGLADDRTCAVVWFWSPQAEAFDYRHYATRGYSQAYYEGFDEFGATPYGIANTNECSVEGYSGMIVPQARLEEFCLRIQKPALYLGETGYYHDQRAFGYWSVKKTDTEMERWLEDQLERAFLFYKNEVEQRSWYGFYDYGDIMHTYDRVRHCWKYDMGGYAWQNTELVPTLWLWLYFMRTQREDVFTMAEAMTRHCSEVDVYHIGPYKGLGSRHNVRHWGCPCKEARIGMAGHHRYYYYLTGDPRMKDIFEDVRDADESTVNLDPLRHFYEKEKMAAPTHARSGPDWSSFCSNWMTRWERFDDPVYLEKIRTGIGDLKQMPLKLVSGTDFEYDPADNHLRYIGEKAAGGTHLQICMGAAEVWLELSLLLDDPEWTELLADYGRFYYLSREEQVRESGGLVNERQFSYPFMAGAMGAFGAFWLNDVELAKKTWRILLRALISDEAKEGFRAVPVPGEAGAADAKNTGEKAKALSVTGHTDAKKAEGRLTEIPWISTNFVSQWCLNVIMALELIGEELPKDWKETDCLMKDMPMDGFRKA